MLAPGSRLGPYELLSPLGRGGMGEVWRARDSVLGREVAIKTLPEGLARDPDRLARFEREAQALASLSHPNVAAIYGLERSGGEPCLVLELVDGETLEARLARGALPVREALRVGVQMAAAIEAAHARGLVHRDLKPGNVMLTRDGAVKVLDFGLARSEPPDAGSSAAGTDALTVAGPARRVDATLPGWIVGTAAYMSPEQARGAHVDRRSDVWSFGCVLFECLAGRRPFEGATASDLLARILEREPDWSALPSGAPARVREILRRCLRKEADERPRDLRDVGLELADLARVGAAREDEARERSIAVLPFDNLGTADDAFFADGMTDEILNALAHVEGLRVAARTSCFAFKGRREDLRAVGEKLDVATVLEGSVRRSGSRLRITVQLVNAADGYQLWSERYDRELTDVFEVQDEIAGAIATRLRGTLAGGGGESPARARHGTASVEAYELFLKARALQYQRGRHILEAMPLFEQAIALDRNYAEPRAWLADSYRLQGTYGMAPFGEVMPRAKALAEQALAIDPGQAEALATLADVEAQYERRIGPALRSWERTLAADPRHVRARCERALWSFAYGVIAPDEAVAEARRGLADDPLNAWAAVMASYMLAYVGRHAESIEISERARSLDPASFIAQWNLLRAYAWAGDDARACAIAPEALAGTGRSVWVVSTLAWLHGKARRAERARACYDEIEARARFEFVSPFWLAAAAAACGRTDEAFHLARRAVDERDPFVVQARVSPMWDDLRAEGPRFAALTQGLWG